MLLAGGVFASAALVAAMAQKHLLAATLAVVPIAVASGTLFPALFDRAARNPLAVFAFDAIGSGAGSLLATFIPIIWGIGAFITLSAAVFFITAAADLWFHRPSNPGADCTQARGATKLDPRQPKFPIFPKMPGREPR